MRKFVRDEFVEHHEGQAIFTARRVIFASVLAVVGVGLGLWYFLGRE